MRYVKAGYVADEITARYGIEIDKWDVVRLSASCLKRIGAFGLKRKVYVTTVDNFCIHMPKDAFKVRGIIRLSAPVYPTSSFTITDGIYQPPQTFFVSDEEETLEPDSITLKNNYVPQLKGVWIDYVDDFPIMKFNETDVKVAVEYTGLATDEEGFPMIPEDCWEACMFFCLFTHVQAAYLAGKINRLVVLDFERWKDTGIAQGRAKMMMSALTSNEKDKLMNIMVSYDRKVYGIPS